MYGRCETDPFDQATDVCDSCYGEFCSACMVKPKRRKYPICRDCAIIASGVRPGAKPLLRGSKKTAAERRKALQDAPSAPRAFEYFNDSEAEEAPTGGDEPIDPELLPVDADIDIEGRLANENENRQEASGKAEVANEPGDGLPGEPAAVEPTETEPAVATGVTPGLAALAKHQADRRAPTVAPESVPAPDWLNGSTTEAESPTPMEAEPVVVTGGDEPSRPLERRLPDEKPVTDGYDWVTQMPPRGASTPLPSRSRDGSSRDPEPGPTGGVATADRPKPGLPKRRSKLRPTDDS